LIHETVLRVQALQRRARWVIWSLFALLLALAPLLFNSGLSITMLSQMGIAIIVCLSYNILLGQGGMLSFGHAVYSGLGSFLAIHALNAAGQGSLPIPVSLVPLVGGLAGMGFAVLLGYVTTKKSGTTFAMITLGIGELVFAMSLMIPEFFGGEGGINGNRVIGKPFMGISFGPPIQVYYLIAVYTFIAVAAMYAFTRTPLGRMLNAVRDNPERVEFIGYNTQKVRYLAFIIAAFFAGISGGLGALNFEIVTAEVVGAARSGAYLLFTFLGGATFFFGPIIGAILMVLAFVLLPNSPRPGCSTWADLPVHGDVRARRHRQPDHDEPARGRIWPAAPAVALLPAAGGHGLVALTGAPP
jgi:branched-chain amino acid transport system permease protein